MAPRGEAVATRRGLRIVVATHRRAAHDVARTVAAGIDEGIRYLLPG